MPSLARLTDTDIICNIGSLEVTAHCMVGLIAKRTYLIGLTESRYARYVDVKGHLHLSITIIG